MRGKFFVSSSSLLNLTLPIHNEALAAPDELTTIRLNHQWRRIVASALYYYFKHDETELALDNEDLLDDLLEDLYTAEDMADKKTILAVSLPADRTRTLSSFATVLGTELNHTFTKTNAKITYSNARVNVSSGAQLGSLRVGIASGTVVSRPEMGANSATARNVRASAIFSGIPTGVATQIRLEFAASGGATVTVFAAHNMLIEIEEWDD